MNNVSNLSGKFSGISSSLSSGESGAPPPAHSRILLHQLPANRQIQNGLPQHLDLIRPAGELVQVVERKPGVAGKVLFGGVGGGQAGEAGGGEAVAGGFSLGAGGFQAVQQGHQFVDFCDDSVLFG